MALPRELFAPSFKRQRASLLFTAIVGFMVFAATLSVTAQTTLSILSLHWNMHAGTKMTIEIPAIGDEATLSQNERVGQTIAVLRAMPHITDVHALTDQETADLLKPWISDASLLRALPVPTLIDLEHDDEILTTEDIKNHIKNIVPDARVDDHASWLGDLKRLVSGIVLLSTTLTLLAALTLAITVSLFCRAVMAGETPTITLLHTMGADDHDIARHFQSLAMRLSWPASFLGFGLAVLGAGCVLLFMHRFTDLAVLELGAWVSLALLAFSVPFAAVVVAALSARISVTKLLQATP